MKIGTQENHKLLRHRFDWFGNKSAHVNSILLLMDHQMTDKANLYLHKANGTDCHSSSKERRAGTVFPSSLLCFHGVFAKTCPLKVVAIGNFISLYGKVCLDRWSSLSSFGGGWNGVGSSGAPRFALGCFFCLCFLNLHLCSMLPL